MDGSAKKRLGQYFSGSRVADLLISLCALSGSETVIDPMSGTGDMLKAAVRFGVPKSNVSGIEIDKDAALMCDMDFEKGRLFVGDAFSLASYEFTGFTSWDVVVTNPPYVRYQSMANTSIGDKIKLKNASEVRDGLSQIVNELDHLSSDEKVYFQRIIKNYSGLSDLAVPSWILCAALVKQGGILAMVVPESWMNRDYALSIKYLLLKFFDIKFIVEDMNAAWFSDALIKTNLVIAKRAIMRDDPLLRPGEHFIHLRLGSNIMGELSLVEKMQYNDQEGKAAFEALVQAHKSVAGDGFELRQVNMEDFISDMAAMQGSKRLLNKLEPHKEAINDTYLPKEIREAISTFDDPLQTVDLETWGFRVGQGLRTGANRFFYAELVASDEAFDYLSVDKEISEQTVRVSRKYSIPALRYQVDAKDRYSITKDMLSYRLLCINESFLNNDGTLREDANKSLADFILCAEGLSVESGGKRTRFSELSAVKPNVRKTVVGGKTIQRHWYMLPALTKRHTPQLCISRVNYKNIRCMTVENGIVVDANFSTLWADSKSDHQIFAMLALMNSSWVRAYLECVASVMGGGALKVEAAHLRQMKLPVPSVELVESLSELGLLLAKSDMENDSEIVRRIDESILCSILKIKNTKKQSSALRELLQAKLNARKK